MKITTKRTSTLLALLPLLVLGCGQTSEDKVAAYQPLLAKQVYSDKPMDTSPYCDRYSAERIPLFGDLHVHTKYSLDASTQDTRTSPSQAYQFAKGEELGIAPWREDGTAMRSVRLERPLDFAAVTDHAELFGEVEICNSPELEGYDSWQCGMYRRVPKAAYFVFNYFSAVNAERMGFCDRDDVDCKAAGLKPWQDMLAAAEQHYDRSRNCDFTTFVAYEWTGVSPETGNLHRNVIFHDEHVPALPQSYVDSPSIEGLMDSLDATCDPVNDHCDVVVIPHNSNLSAGMMFKPLQMEDKALKAQLYQRRAHYERLVEIMQHKGASECYFDPLTTSDELCAFEPLPYDRFSGQQYGGDEVKQKADTGFVRDSLKDGIVEQIASGENPYKWGFIGSTDTHLGAPGLVDEKAYPGHGGAGGGATEAGLTDTVEYNPGGLAVVWAEQNNRDAIFAAMKRREAYATSGPRMTVRFFGGDLPEDICQSTELAKQGYSNGVPMGGDITALAEGQAPRFVVSASQDVGTLTTPANPLQKIQIIKGWVDAEGNKQEQIVHLVGDEQSRGTVDTNSCAVGGGGHAALCGSWQDPSFDAQQHAYYYARVIENPSCRWSQYSCVEAQVSCDDTSSVGEGLEHCCDTSIPKTQHERAWTSPIWFSPTATTPVDQQLSVTL
ncbi:DUF3604 domain-containing protein [Sinobacterium norvegicum]|nr:DUF3604 domain-containing protein [Sinobacterium norvegicum]